MGHSENCVIFCVFTRSSLLVPTVARNTEFCCETGSVLRTDTQLICLYVLRSHTELLLREKSRPIILPVPEYGSTP